MFDSNELIQAALDEFVNQGRFPRLNKDERMGGRAAIRGMMVRLGLYDQFLKCVVHAEVYPDITPMMAEFKNGHRLDLPHGYWMEKRDDNTWHIGENRMQLAYTLQTNTPCGEGGSFDHEARRFAKAMNGGKS